MELTTSPNPWMILPFAVLLAAIALAPLFFADWWQKHHPTVAWSLGALTVAYYLIGLNGREHHDFTQKRRIVNEHRAQDYRQEKKVGQSFKPPDIVRFGEFFANSFRRAQIVDLIHQIKYRQKHAQANGPNRPAMFCDPPEGNALQVTQKKRRIANRGEAAADV